MGARVYAAGFPNWHWINENAIENTRDWGLKAFRLTTGKVGMVLDRSLLDGYQLGYTNDVADGMSGGAIFARYGKLVGIKWKI